MSRQNGHVKFADSKRHKPTSGSCFWNKKMSNFRLKWDFCERKSNDCATRTNCCHTSFGGASEGELAEADYKLVVLSLVNLIHREN